MKAKTLIVDDEKMARSELAYLIGKDNRFEVVEKAASGREAISLLKENKYDLVLLDIKMPGFSGIEVARLLKEFKNPPQLVFTTAYDEYAVEAFKLAAVDYLLKPINEKRFKETLSRVWIRLKEVWDEGNNQLNKINENDLNEELKEGIKNKNIKFSKENEIANKIDHLLEIFEKNKESVDPGKIPVEDNGRYRLLNYSQIYYFSTSEKKVKVHTKKSSYLTHLNLKDLEEKLPANFFRIHRSYIVNLNQIKEVIPWFKGKYQIVISDNVEHEIPVSRTKVNKLNKLLNLK